ncbi:hypothetical protein, partial [Staphylococcus epidermidis]|uniref:hypothetical protein n=1 Tax=Staphylococcus epidermidis TaxID=1282 RepID=UPI0028CB23C2
MENFDKTYHHKTHDILAPLTYLTLFFPPVFFPLILSILPQPPPSTYSTNPLFNHIFTSLSFPLALISFPAPLSFIHSTNPL